jgi:hypothetical protein
MTVSAIPSGYHTITTPYFSVRDAQGLSIF